MKKAISLFLALSVLCFATSAMAVIGNNTVTGSKNNVTTMPDSSSASMPGFRPGDTITFNVTGVTQDKELTLISYKMGSEASLSNSTVQYINQYTLTGASQSISYKIRENLASGKYVVKINDSANNTVATFYYKVGKADIKLVTGPSTTVNAGTLGSAYRIEKVNGVWHVGFIGKVTLDNNEYTLADIGATPGFVLRDTYTGTNKKAKGYFGEAGNRTVANLQDAQINGTYSFIYGLTVYNVPEGHQTYIKAAATLDTLTENLD